MPPPSKLKRKILIKNKRLSPEVEKQELELFLQGQLEILDDEDIKEDPSAPPKDPKVVNIKFFSVFLLLDSASPVNDAAS